MTVCNSSSQSTEAQREAVVWNALKTVTDPEIPVVNVVEMGIIAGVRFVDSGVAVDLTPTFAGCPALNVIREDIQRAITEAGEQNVTVNLVYDPPWTTDRLTEEARGKLKAFGLAPPGAHCGETQMPELDQIPCPFCDSTSTELESLFGPTLCRSMHYCHACLQPFEHFKSV